MTAEEELREIRKKCREILRKMRDEKYDDRLYDFVESTFECIGTL